MRADVSEYTDKKGRDKSAEGNNDAKAMNKAWYAIGVEYQRKADLAKKKQIHQTKDHRIIGRLGQK